MINRVEQHRLVLGDTLRRMWRNGFANLMTILALGIGLSIPAILYSLVDEFADFSAQWQARPQISLFVKKSADETAIQATLEQVQMLPNIEGVQYVSPETGLKDFKQFSDFGAALDLLDSNPLPPLIVVYPAKALTPEAIHSLKEELTKLPLVESAQYDLAWIERLHLISKFLKRAVLILAALLAIGVILLISNTIRLEITSRKVEIDVIDQLGGTPAFIRRPFLYLGFLQGLLGGLVALLVSTLTLTLLAEPIRELIALYHSNPLESLMNWKVATLLLIGGAVLGWAASLITTTRHLISLRPR